MRGTLQLQLMALCHSQVTWWKVQILKLQKPHIPSPGNPTLKVTTAAALNSKYVRAGGVTLSRTGFRLKRPEPKANTPYLPYVKAAGVWRLGPIFILALLNSRFPYVKPAGASRFILHYEKPVFIFILALLISYPLFHILLFSTLIQSPGSKGITHITLF
jgi:hypothetical protein